VSPAIRDHTPNTGECASP